jgi:hypothetical protein
MSLHYRWSQLLTAAAFAGIYLLLAESLDRSELLAAFATGLVATFVLSSVSRAAQMHFRFRLRWLSEARRLPLQIVRDCFALILALPRLAMRQRQILKATRLSRDPSGSNVRASFGRFITKPLPPIQPPATAPESAGHRALAIINISVAPNTYVVEVERSCVQIHQLLPPVSAAGASG